MVIQRQVDLTETAGAELADDGVVIQPEAGGQCALLGLRHVHCYSVAAPESEP
ncbi:hypothetical protein D3C86_2174730 [compost metagenome]